MTALDEATFTRAIEIDGHRRLCRHEAGHATAALLLGLDVESVTAEFWTLHELEHSDLDEPAGQAVIYSKDQHSHEMAVTTLCGPMCEPRHDWPPEMIVATHAPDTPDARHVGEYVRAVDLDRDAYADLCAEARALTDSPAFKRLHGLIVDALADPPHTIGRAQVRHLKAIAENTDMEHLTLKAATVEAVDTNTELGTFTALASAWEADREGDTIDHAAFDKTIAAWKASGKNLPLLYEHSSEEIGAIDPASMHATEAGLVVSGEVDRTTEHGAQSWRQIKRGTAGFSIGFMSKSRPRSDGRKGSHIVEIDLFEISHTSTPAHPATRALEWKSMGDPDLSHIRNEWRDSMAAFITSSPATKTVETLRAKSDRIAREVAPIQTATFEC